jgi:GNAT superfamily N-acetyltransferase
VRSTSPATFEATGARIVADYAGHHDPARATAWIAEREGARVGCVVVVAATSTTAQLRALLVQRAARGNGTGGRLVETAVAFARDAGYERMRLWTNSVLTAAIHLYRKAGFVLVKAEPHHSYGADLVGETYELTLR